MRFYGKTVLNGSIADWPRTIWSGGGLYSFMSTSRKLWIRSTSAEDASGGQGCYKYRIEGLDSTWDVVSETIYTVGTIPVISDIYYRRVNKVVALECPTALGSKETNVGRIEVRAESGSGDMQATIEPGMGQSHQAVYTVPNGQTVFLNSYSAYVGIGSQDAMVAIMARQWGSVTAGNVPAWVTYSPFRAARDYHHRHVNANSYQLEYFGPKTDIMMVALSVGGDCELMADFELANSGIV